VKPCVKRKTVVRFEADGSKEDTFQCAEKSAPKHTMPVVEADCEACPVRDAVNKASIDREARRTSNLRGFIRQEPDQGSPSFPACDSRIIATVQSCCGQTGSVWICDHRASSRFQAEVTPDICHRCPFKS
jgi:hypothetical protein